MKIKPAILSLLVFSFLPISASAEMVTRNRTVVDTVASMKIIKGKYDKINNKTTTAINFRNKNIEALQAKTDGLEMERDKVRSIFNLVAPKVKSQSDISNIHTFLSQEISKLSDDSIFKYVKEKDFKKAYNNKESDLKLIELRRKTIEKVLKDANKGKFESGIVRSTFLQKLNQLDNEIILVNKEENNEWIERNKLQEKLVPIPSTFNATLWLKEMPGQDVPIKTLTERRERTGEDDLSFEEAISKYYPDLPYKVESYRSDLENLVISGKFNGLIYDRIGLFPLESSKIKYRDGWEVDNYYGKMILISEKGTVPNLIVDCKGSVFNFDYYSNLYSSSVSIAPLAYWDNELGQRDGIYIESNNSEGTSFDAFTYILENGEWVNRRPLSVEYMTLEEVRNRMKEIGTEPIIIEGNYYCNHEFFREGGKFKFLITSNKLLGIRSVTKEADKVFAFYIDNSDQSSNSYTDRSSINITDFEKIYVKKNYFGVNNDAVFVERNKVGKKEIDIFRVYSIFDEPGSSWDFGDNLSIGDSMGLYNIKDNEGDI